MTDRPADAAVPAGTDRSAGAHAPAAANRHGWVDASAGVAGDMLLGALLDAGAGLDVVQAAIDAVIPGAVQVVATPVLRAGLRALKVDIRVLVDDPPHRTWRHIRRLLQAGPPARSAAQSPPDSPGGVATSPDVLPASTPSVERIRRRATAVFARLADAEAQVHGIAAEDVHFHEVGALDAIADVVGVCAALEALGIATLSAGEVAVGSGRVRTAHGELPVPVPAVAHLSQGWRVHAGGRGELATPTGMAVIRALAVTCEDLPAMSVEAVGVGAGGRDTPERPNVVRVVVGAASGRTLTHDGEPAVVLEANVDDLDPRLWPGVLAGLLRAGAADAWLVPIIMKKGRPAHTLTVLCHPERAGVLRDQIFRHTTTLGVRESFRRKVALARTFVDVTLDGSNVAVKVAHRDGIIVQVMPEFDDVAGLAARRGRPERVVLQAALAAAATAGLTVGSALPAPARGD